MCNLLLAIFFAFSPIATDEACTAACDISALHARIETNRERIFGRLGHDLEQALESDLEAAMKQNEYELTGNGR